jgi:hypothetical protein
MEEYLEDLISFEELPGYIKTKMTGPNSENTWQDLQITYHSENRLRFKNYEKMSFYRDLIRSQRLKLEVFPYHLCRFLNFTSPFDYYIDMLCDLLRVQKTYDTLPTFTAADILRIVGIHRNSYTDLLQKCKEKGWISKISRAIRSMLPKYPLTIPVDGWWLVFPLLHKRPRKTANKNEVECLSEICKDFMSKAHNSAGRYDREALEGLFKATVVEFDIEVEGFGFELVRDIKNFVPDKTGFGKQIGDVLRLCQDYSDFESVLRGSKLRVEVVKDALSLLCRLGFIEVQNVVKSDWHRSWMPLSDLENSLTSSVLPSFEVSSGDDIIKITLALGKEYSPPALKQAKELLLKYQLEILESPKSAIALSSSSIDSVIFSSLTSHESLLYRLFKLKYCGTSPVLYLTKGFILTRIPESLSDFRDFILCQESSIKDSSISSLLFDLSQILPVSSVFILPCTSKLHHLLTIPLPLNLLSIKDKSLLTFFREKELNLHFENFIGWLELAVLADKSFLILSQNHGVDLSSKEATFNILTNLLETPWFKYNNLESVSEAQQDEVFQFREFICGVDVEQGFILLD